MTVLLGLLALVVLLGSGVALMLYGDRRQHRRMLDITRGGVEPSSGPESPLRPVGTVDAGGEIP